MTGLSTAKSQHSEYLTETDSMMAKLSILEVRRGPTCSNCTEGTPSSSTSSSSKQQEKESDSSNSKYPEFWRKTAFNRIREHKTKALETRCKRAYFGILRPSKLTRAVNNLTNSKYSQSKNEGEIMLSELIKQGELTWSRTTTAQPPTDKDVPEDLDFNSLSIKSNYDEGNETPEVQLGQPPLIDQTLRFSISSKNRLCKSRQWKWKTRLNLRSGFISGGIKSSSSCGSLPSIPEEDNEDCVPHSATAPAGSSNGNQSTCSQQALMETSSDDVTIDELASYLDVLVHIPKKMSPMAEMMYT